SLDDGGIDLVNSSVSFTLGAFLENLTLTGTAVIDGAGNALANTITGNTADNILRGGDDKDTLKGGNGNDTLYGGSGSDFLTGGANDDHFVFDTALGPTNVDKILDFVEGSDELWLDHLIFSAATADSGGHLIANQFRIGTAALSSSDHVIYDKAHGALFYDLDGVGGAAQIQFASVTANLNLAANDILIV
ncbi:hypothetical protein B5V02_22185, partial [Mesorhizobium kowhaii]